MLLKKCPIPVICHHAGPFKARTEPDKIKTANDANDKTPNT